MGKAWQGSDGNGVSASDVAQYNADSAQTLPREAPSGTARCPAGVIRIGVFFDGTGNNTDFADAQAPKRAWSEGKPSNVAKLHFLYEDDQAIVTRVYHHGVGSTDSIADKLFGGAFGAGGKSRVGWGQVMVTEFFNRNNNHLATHKYIDVYGFSRGAAISRDFVNRVKNFPIRNTAVGPIRTDWVYVGHGMPPQKVEYYKELESVEMCFLGVFDTVGSFTVPGKDLDVGYDFNVNEDFVKKTVHLIAEDEMRSAFSLQSIKGKGFWSRLVNRSNEPEPLPRNMMEKPYPGAHSDVGGGYEPGSQGKKQHLCHIPLKDMHAESLKIQVPLKPLSNLPTQFYEIPGDLQQAYEQYCSDRAGLLGDKYIQALPGGEYETKMLARRELASWRALRQAYIHNQLDEWGATTFIDKSKDWLIDKIPFHEPAPRQRQVYYNGSRQK